MATSSPFSWFGELIGKLGDAVQPPAWLTHEVQHRAVLFLNHVLMQEPQAQERLQRRQGRNVRVAWRQIHVQLQVTPAGLFELSDAGAPDLTLTVTDESPLALARAAATGERPAIRIEGDVQLAADINWLVDNLRWDVEEDLARVIGDSAAHTLGNLARSLAGALKGFVDKATSFGRGKSEP